MCLFFVVVAHDGVSLTPCFRSVEVRSPVSSFGYRIFSYVLHLRRRVNSLHVQSTRPLKMSLSVLRGGAPLFTFTRFGAYLGVMKTELGGSRCVCRTHDGLLYMFRASSSPLARQKNQDDGPSSRGQIG